jgi:hypothetical protein
MMGATRNSILFSVVMLLMMGLVASWQPPVLAAEPAVRSVQGEVIAVTVDDTPQIIVVKTVIGTKKEMIVGATVESGTVITRGKNRVSLADVKVGEKVELKYIKNAEGLVAKSVRVR